MRFFYVQSIKRFIFLPAVIIFTVTLLIQFVPAFFMNELAVFARIKAKLGYPISFFPENTLLPLRFLFSLFYAFISGFLGFIVFKLKHRSSGHTLLFTNNFKIISGILFILLSYSLMYSEKYILNPINLPKIAVNSDFVRFLSLNLDPNYFKPKININLSNQPTKNTQGTAPQTSGSNKTPQNPVNPPANNNTPKKVFTPDVSNNGNSNSQPVTRTATAQELYAQLNSYRARNGRTALIWDNNLGNYAQKRANLFASLGKTDNHAGFLSDTANGINYDFGFFGLSENAGYGVTGSAKYIIEDWFGTSPAHNNAQLSSKWSHVGVGVNGKAFDFIFGGGKTDSFHQE